MAQAQRNCTATRVTSRDSIVLGNELVRAFPVPTTGSFDDLLQAIDKAETPNSNFTARRHT